jgi:uncharacterized damage-inducible protein DinB
MAHPLIQQYYFTRKEWQRGLKGVNDEDAAKHFGPMNCISWTVGHLAWHEQKNWLERAQNKVLFPELNTLYAYNAPMSTPALCDMLKYWKTVTKETETFLDSLTTEDLEKELLRHGKSVGQTLGSAMHRITYHYWYHIGEIQAIRQMLGQKDLPVYVGDIEKLAPYTPE